MLRMIEAKWSTIKILSSLKSEVNAFCQKQKEFANPSQFIAYAVRRELEERQTHGIKYYISNEEIKNKIQFWKDELQKRIELEERLEKAFEGNKKTHAKYLSQL